nr:MAG TPA: hypothetical protein [Caudoviricetes sp.]
MRTRIAVLTVVRTWVLTLTVTFAIMHDYLS